MVLHVVAFKPSSRLSLINNSMQKAFFVMLKDLALGMANTAWMYWTAANR